MIFFMNKMLTLLICITMLVWCTSNKNSELPLGVNFNIPDTYTQIDNSKPITVNGIEVVLSWDKLQVWDTLKNVSLDMKADYFDQVWTWSIQDFKWYKLIQTVPSLDTPVCTMQTKQLEFAAGEFKDTTFIVISNDTPFALQRFCSANSIDNLKVFSDARTREFWLQNGFLLEDYSLLTRSIMIVDKDNVIQYIEYADEVTSELDLMNALAYLKSIL